MSMAKRFLALLLALGLTSLVAAADAGAQTIVGIANRNPVSTFESNIRGTWSLLEACRRSPTVSEIVIASSDKAYGSHDVLPYDEAAALQAKAAGLALEFEPLFRRSLELVR